MTATAAVTFFGFLGIEKIHQQIQGLWKVSPLAIELLFNTLVLVVLVAAIINLIYRLPGRAAEHHRAIHTLTDFIRDVEDKIELDAAGLALLTVADLEKVRERYKGMVASLPPSTDKEFLQSKADYAAKKRKSASLDHDQNKMTLVPRSGDPPISCQARLKSLLSSNPERLAILQVIRKVGPGLWVTGGFVRNIVWDDLHNYIVPTPLDDVDVIYFDESKDTVRREGVLGALRSAAPNVNWSVKNQAEMRDRWWPTTPESLDEALRRYTDTATAIAVRLVDNSNLEVLAPYGLEDLFELIVRPTPDFDLTTYEARLSRKNWGKTWPRLKYESRTA